MITQFTPIHDQPKAPMWKPPQGWFRAYHLERDAQALLIELEHNNECRRMRGLPTFTPSIELASAAIARADGADQPPATTECGEFEGYKVSLSCDPVYYGSECTDADAERIFGDLSEFIRSQFPGIQVVRWDDVKRSSVISGPDESVCEEIDQWISDNWTKVL